MSTTLLAPLLSYRGQVPSGSHPVKGKEGVHRFITGKLIFVSGDLQEIKLMTPEGEGTFAVQQGGSKLSGMREGTPITIELNEAGHVIVIRRAG